MGTKIIPWCTNWVTAVNLSTIHWIHQYFVVEHKIAIFYIYNSMYIVISRLKMLDYVLNDAVLIENIWNHEKRTSTLTQHQRLVIFIVRCRSRWHIWDIHAQFHEFSTYGHMNLEILKGGMRMRLLFGTIFAEGTSSSSHNVICFPWIFTFF